MVPEGFWAPALSGRAGPGAWPCDTMVAFCSHKRLQGPTEVPQWRGDGLVVMCLVVAVHTCVVVVVVAHIVAVFQQHAHLLVLCV